MSIQLTGAVQAIHEAFIPHSKAVSFDVYETMHQPYAEAEFEAAERAYDAQQEERAIYCGMTEEEFLRRTGWDDDDESDGWPDERPTPTPSYADMIMEFDGHRIYVHCDCEYCAGYCLCADCTEASARHNLSWWQRLWQRFW